MLQDVGVSWEWKAAANRQTMALAHEELPFAAQVAIGEFGNGGIKPDGPGKVLALPLHVGLLQHGFINKGTGGELGLQAPAHGECESEFVHCEVDPPELDVGFLKEVAAGLSGGDGGRMVSLADPLLIVPTSVPARNQEMHIMLGQMLCNAVEIEMGLAPEARD